jgi:hypothetical protein
MKAFYTAMLFVLAVTSLPASGSDSSAPAIKSQDARTAEIKNRLNSIFIDKFNLYNVPMVPAVIRRYLEYLTKRSKELDPTHVGVRIRLQESQDEPKDPDPLQGATHLAVSTLENVPIRDVLDYICQQSQMDYSIENGEVVLFRAPQKASSH